MYLAGSFCNQQLLKSTWVNGTLSVLAAMYRDQWYGGLRVAARAPMVLSLELPRDCEHSNHFDSSTAPEQFREDAQFRLTCTRVLPNQAQLHLPDSPNR